MRLPPPHDAAGRRRYDVHVLFRPSPKPTKADVLGGKPVRSPAAREAEVETGRWELTIPLLAAKTGGWASRLLRVPEGATKTFEIDELGKFVWDACDGKTTVTQIIRRLAKHYRLNGREAN